jgi:uncharacterized spore protein YtfJ
MEDIKELMDEMLSKFDSLSKTKTVVGEPIEVKGKTLIPFIEVSIGVGTGGGTGEGGSTDEKGRQGKGVGKGAGAGGGLRVSPVAVVSIDDKGVSAYSVNEKKGFLGKMAEIMPQMMEKAMEKKPKAPPEEPKQ